MHQLHQLLRKRSNKCRLVVRKGQRSPGRLRDEGASDGVYLLTPRGDADKRHSSHNRKTTRFKEAEVGSLEGAEGRRRLYSCLFRKKRGSSPRLRTPGNKRVNSASRDTLEAAPSKRKRLASERGRLRPPAPCRETSLLVYERR